MIAMAIAAMEDDYARDFMTGIYIKYYDIMLSKAKAMLENEEDAEEVIQDIFLDLIERVGTVMSVDPKKLPSYLMAAVRNSSMSKIRKRMVRREHTLLIDEDDSLEWIKDESALPEDVYIKNEEIDEIAKALSLLPENDRTVLEDKYILEMSDEEIGKALGITPAGVRTRLFRARRKAYAIMKEGAEK
ncbi:MAG: sigma-70 family RNA polymerase sigma factor [Oscillospiraceae bacterium]|nr:sigma-70 family RNA polymerase sigma factor [Oscillospiraceae bacterium]